MLDEHYLIQGPLRERWIQAQFTAFSKSWPESRPYPDVLSTEQEQSLHEVYASSHQNSGAIASFQGIIRSDLREGVSVLSIDYSAYEQLANRRFADIEEEVKRRTGLNRLRIWHSVGQVRCGECSMLVLASAAHRAELFEGLHLAVEQVKFSAPVWKCEQLSNGQHRWVEGQDDPAAIKAAK